MRCNLGGFLTARGAAAVSIAGILLAVALYFYSAALYSQATTLDPAAGGYRHFSNYWCDLYGHQTYTGQSNPARPYAMAATLLLTLALLAFWPAVAALFPAARTLARIARYAGAAAFAIASLIFTSLHDLVILTAVPLGVAALVATCIGLARSRHGILLLLALLATGLALYSYIIWAMALQKPLQPLIQKVAFAFFFVWVVLAALRVLLLPRSSPVADPSRPIP